MNLGLGTWKEKIKGKDRYETIENYLIVAIAVGVLILTAGFLLSILNPKGISAILLMLGSFVSFVSTVVIVIVWVVKELRG